MLAPCVVIVIATPTCHTFAIYKYMMPTGISLSYTSGTNLMIIWIWWYSKLTLCVVIVMATVACNATSHPIIKERLYTAQDVEMYSEELVMLRL